MCHEVTEAVVDALEAKPVDLLVTYHPLLFRPTNRIVAGRSPTGRAFRLLKAGVALAVTHTSFDAAEGGTADSLAGAFDLQDVSPFGPVTPAGQVKFVTFVPGDAVERVADAMSAAGAGEIGNYSACSFRASGTGAFTPGESSAPVVGEIGAPSREPEVRLEMVAPAGSKNRVSAALVAAHPYEEPAFDIYDVEANLGFIGRVGTLPSTVPLGSFVDDVMAQLAPRGIRVTGDSGASVSTVAVLPGSGGSFVGAARAAGADVLVTGDVGHHTAMQAQDMGLAVVDVGHTTSERPGMRALAGVVSSVASSLGGTFLDHTGLDPTPWR